MMQNVGHFWLCILNLRCLKKIMMMMRETASMHCILTTWVFPGGTSGKEPACQCRRLRNAGLIPGLGRSPGGRHGNPLQYSCLENPHGQRSLVGYSPLGCRESEATQHSQHVQHYLKNFTLLIHLFLIASLGKHYHLHFQMRN